MALRRFLLAVAGAAAFSFAAQAVPTASTYQSATGNTLNAQGTFCVPATDGSGCTLGKTDPNGNAIYSSPGGSSGDGTGSVTTANTFQTVFAASTTRNTCLIQNTSANTEQVKYGAGTIMNVQTGGSFNCNSSGWVERSAILITSSVQGSTFSASSN